MAKEKEFIQKEGFDFTFTPEACRECQGKCCNGVSGNIFVNTKEVKAISEFLEIEIPTFIQAYLIKVSYKFSIKEVRAEKDYACIFFNREKSRCSIYAVRPNQCRTFPFWSYFKDKPEEAARECPGISSCEA